MSVVGLLSVSDGRPAVHRDLEAYVKGVEDRIAASFEAEGHSVVRGREIVWSNDLAVSEARRIADARPCLTLINIPVWAFPQFTALASRELEGPLLLFSNASPEYPGMVGMLAAAGTLDQFGRRYWRAWGDVEDPAVWRRVQRCLKAGATVTALRGTTFGRIGGRPMGMYTAVSNSDVWLTQFGIDVEEIDQWEIVRRADEVDSSRVSSARHWLEKNAAGVHYDGARLTPDILEKQIRAYYVMRMLIAERKLAFCGIKAQPELTDNFATTDIAEAFLNDPYDWDGDKPPFVCSTEADMDGALTMQLLAGLTGKPVLFADMRHYHSDLGIWDLCNSGQHPTWFAARSDDPLENMRRVHLYPQTFYFPAGGAAVHHLAAPGEFTFARLTRCDRRYRMHVLKGQIEQFDAETNERLMQASTYVWPHAFVRFTADAEEILGRYGSNHIHAIEGDHVATLQHVCSWLGVEFDLFGDAH